MPLLTNHSLLSTVADRYGIYIVNLDNVCKVYSLDSSGDFIFTLFRRYRKLTNVLFLKLISILIFEEDEETFNSSETGEFMNEAENDLDADEEYLDALCGEENPADNNQVNEDGDRDILASGRLYNGAPITVGVSMLLIIAFAVCHSLTGVAVVDLLILVSLHCALPNQCASSMELLKTFFMKLKNPIQFHIYCTFCMEYQGLCISENGLCKNKGCLKNLKEKGNSSY